MAGMLFWFEETDVFSGRQVHIDAWRYAAVAGQIDTIRCINKTDQKIHMGNMDFKIVGETDEDFIMWCNNHLHQNLVFVETKNSCPESAIPLKDVKHEHVDWYIFGAGCGYPRVYDEESETFKSYVLDKQCVYLPTFRGAQLHPLHIGSCVMLRRYEEIGDGNGG